MLQKVAAELNLPPQFCLGDGAVQLKAGSKLIFRRLVNGASTILVLPPGEETDDTHRGSNAQTIESDCKLLLTFQS